MSSVPSSPRDRLWRWARFGLGSACSYLLVIGVTVGLREGIGWSPRYAYLGALVTAWLFNFFFNRHVVFRSTGTQARRQALRFVLTSSGFRVLEWITFALLAAWSSAHYVLLVTAVQVASLLIKYVVFRRFVFA